jgi:hypothetical protein
VQESERGAQRLTVAEGISSSRLHMIRSTARLTIVRAVVIALPGGEALHKSEIDRQVETRQDYYDTEEMRYE